MVIMKHVVKRVKYGVFYGPYFPTFELNMEKYSVSLRIQFECGKIRTRKNSVFGHFSCSAGISNLEKCLIKSYIHIIKNIYLDEESYMM